MPTISVMEAEPFIGQWAPKSVTVEIPIGEYAKAELYVLAEPITDWGDRAFSAAAADVELFRFITPVGGVEYTVDVTRFLKLFRGTTQFKVLLGSAAQWNVTIRLTLTEGPAPPTPNYIPLILWHRFYEDTRSLSIPATIPDGTGFILSANAYARATQKGHDIYADGVKVARLVSIDYLSVPVGELIPVNEVEVPFKCQSEIFVDLPTTFTWGGGYIISSLAAIIEAPPPVTYNLMIATTVGGTTDPLPDTYTYDEGTLVTVLAKPDVDYNFDSWILNGVKYTTNPINVLMDKAHSLTAYFSAVPPQPPETYNLTIAATVGGTTGPEPGVHEYDVDTTVTVTAIPENGYYFRYWELDGTERTENPINVLMDRDYLLRAVFSTVAPPPPVEINLPTIGGIALATVDAALILYYIATHIFSEQ